MYEGRKKPCVLRVRNRERTAAHPQFSSLCLSWNHARRWFFFFFFFFFLSLCWDLLQLQNYGFIPYLPCFLTIMATSLVPPRFLSFLRMPIAPIWQSLSRLMSGRRKKKEEEEQEQEGRSKWRSFLIPLVCTVEILFLIMVMYVNNCPQQSSFCVLGFLGRFSFQPFRENPLLGPSSST